MACDDGAIRIVDLESFTEQKRLPAVDAKCLSICSSSTERNTIYAGYGDSSVRKWHYNESGTHKLLQKMEVSFPLINFRLTKNPQFGQLLKLMLMLLLVIAMEISQFGTRSQETQLRLSVN